MKRIIVGILRLAKTRFYQDNFVEEIEFQFLELHVIEED